MERDEFQTERSAPETKPMMIGEKRRQAVQKRWNQAQSISGTTSCQSNAKWSLPYEFWPLIMRQLSGRIGAVFHLALRSGIRYGRVDENKADKRKNVREVRREDGECGGSGKMTKMAKHGKKMAKMAKMAKHGKTWQNMAKWQFAMSLGIQTDTYITIRIRIRIRIYVVVVVVVFISHT